MGRVITFGSNARHAVLEGMQELEDAVISTLGPRGRTVLLDSGNEHPVLTKDGVSVARFITFSDHYKRIGASLIKEAATKTDAIAGDGTTTTVLLTTELCKAGNKLIIFLVRH